MNRFVLVMGVAPGKNRRDRLPDTSVGRFLYPKIARSVRAELLNAPRVERIRFVRLA